MRFAYFGLRARVIALTAAAAFPSIIAVMYAGVEQRRDAERDAEMAVFHLARIAATEHRRLLEETRNLLAVFAKQPEILSNDPAVCGAFLARFLDSGGPYANFGAVTQAGQLNCSGVPLESPIDVREVPVFRRALEAPQMTTGGYVVGRITGQPVLVVTHPVERTSGVGVVFAAVSLKWLNDLISRSSLPEQTRTTVFDRDFRVLARFPNPDEWIGQDASASGLVSAIRENADKGTAHAVDLTGSEQLYGIAPLYDGSGEQVAYVAIGVALNVALADAEALLKRSLAAVILLLFLLALIAWVGGRAFVTRPIRQLIEVSQRMQRGDFTVRAPLARGYTELDELARAYNTMADSLQLHEKVLQDHVENFAFLNRVYAVSSASNGAILRIRDKVELFQEICRIAVEEGCFRAAWIGELVNEKITPVAYTGLPRRNIELICDNANELYETGSMPTIVALRDGRHTVWDEHQLIASALGETFLEFGIRASASFPLSVRGETVACFTLYAKEPDIFDTGELRLLQNIAADASFGLEYLEKEQHQQHLAYYDSLTDLPNPRMFRETLEKVLLRDYGEKRLCAVVVMGLRDLRRITDALGRHVGDALAQHVAKQLSGRAEEKFSLARLSQEEFALLICNVNDIADIHARVDDIVAMVPRLVRIESQLINLSWSIGAAIHSKDGAEADVLIRNAERASHSADLTDSYVPVFYTPSLEDDAKARLEMEAGLRDAMRNNEFSLCYQPVVDIKSGKTVSVEALLRWQHSDLGHLTAASFVPVAEETGLIVPIGEWIIECARKQNEIWHEKGITDIPIALNVSAKQLQQPEFAQQMFALADRYDHVSLAIEVTESELIRNVQSTIELLRQFKSRGISIYVDDFGTGYSSLSYLQQLPIDVVKIDRSFIQDLSTNPRTRAMVQAIITMAHGLGLRVVAEGVEQAAELQILKEMNCDAVQGFYFGQPASGEDVEAFFNRNMLAA